MAELLNRAWLWITNVFRQEPTDPTTPETSSLIVAAVVEDEPDEPVDDIVYVVGRSIPLYAAMRCPCGCGETLRMNLRSEAKPSWRWYIGEAGAATLSPSVWKRDGCRSHFFIRDGRIIWAIDENED